MRYQMVYDDQLSPIFDTFGEAFQYFLETAPTNLFNLYPELRSWDGTKFTFGVSDKGEEVSMEILTLTEEEALYQELERD